jgi:hypothetical protein
MPEEAVLGPVSSVLIPIIISVLAAAIAGGTLLHSVLTSNNYGNFLGSAKTATGNSLPSGGGGPEAATAADLFFLAASVTTGTALAIYWIWAAQDAAIAGRANPVADLGLVGALFGVGFGLAIASILLAVYADTSSIPTSEYENFTGVVAALAIVALDGDVAGFSVMPSTSEFEVPALVPIMGGLGMAVDADDYLYCLYKLSTA